MLSLIFAIFVSAPNWAMADEAKIKSCKNFVQSFYSWYLTKCQGNQTEDSTLAVFKNKKFGFSKELETKLKEDHDVAALFPGEIVGLDFDPFLNAQDVAQKCTVGKASQSGEKYRVEVFSVFDGKKNSKPDVVPELIQQNGNWIFINFLYPDASIPVNKDLLSVLNQLKKDRPPLPKKHTKHK